MSKYYTLKVKQIIKETLQASTIYFKQPLLKKIKYLPGQFLTLIVEINGKPYMRSYSICTVFNLDDTIGITVKRLENGLISNFLNDHIKIGDTIKVMEPAGIFTLKPDGHSKKHYILIGAGSGITPLFSILKSILFFESPSVVSLIYANRNQQNIIFKNSLEKLRNQFGNRLNIIEILSQPEAEWKGYTGRINKKKFEDIMNNLPKFSDVNTYYYLCGPNGLMNEVKSALNSLNVSEKKIFTESFISTEENNESENFKERIITILLDRKEYKLTVPPEKTILEAALDENIDMPFSCQNGLCTACQAMCKSGKVKMTQHDGLSDEEIEEGYVLTCSGHPLTDNVMIEVG